MVSIKIIAIILLVFRLISVGFIIAVLKRQYRLLKLPVELFDQEHIVDVQEIKKFRKVLFVLSCVVLAGNFIPIAIDGLTMFYDLGRPSALQSISIAYAFSNAITAMVSAILIWLLYYIADRDLEDNSK